MPVADPLLDPITGFLNRKAGLRAAAILVAESNTSHTPLGAIWVDIDRFRQVNESFGHRGGDRVIALIAERIRTVVRHQCEYSRTGSDEFVLLVPAIDHADAEQLARRLLVEIERPLRIDTILIRPSASIGVAINQIGENPIALLERADRSMVCVQV